MPKQRTSRADIRESRKRKRQQQARLSTIKKRSLEAKRLVDDPQGYSENAGDYCDGLGIKDLPGAQKHPEEEYFGLLDDQETEAFQYIDRTLRDNELSSAADVEGHVEMAYNYAEGRELKLACSQSFSRFLERLILLSNTAQKKTLLKKFAGHFMSLLRHRFASHICETLFMQCAPIVSEELVQGFDGSEGTDGEDGEESMEALLLATLDELEGYLDFLITHRFGSHTLRVLLLILTGRPLVGDAANAILHSKSKEDVAKDIMVQKDWMKSPRTVPESFLLATKKIIQDSTANMDATAFRIMSKHPIGNPTLQLLLDLDISLAKETKEQGDGGEGPQLLFSMLPDAPKSLADPQSTASDFFTTLLFDPLGSRLLEVLVTMCPGKIFKPIYNSILKPRLDTFVKNETSAYPVLKAIKRLGKSDLEEAVTVIEPLVPMLVQKRRYNIITTLFERCDARCCTPEIEYLIRSLSGAFGWGYNKIVRGLFLLDEKTAEVEPCGSKEKSRSSKQQDVSVSLMVKPRSAVLPHAANLANAMLSIPSKPRHAIQASLLALEPHELASFAKESAPMASVLVKALQVPAVSPTQGLSGESKRPQQQRSPTLFHKPIIAGLIPHVLDLSLSQHGHNVICAIGAIPVSSRDHPEIEGIPLFVKQNLMAALSQHEEALRASKEGRRVWYAWNGVLYSRNPAAWSREMKRASHILSQK